MTEQEKINYRNLCRTEHLSKCRDANCLRLEHSPIELPTFLGGYDMDWNSKQNLTKGYPYPIMNCGCFLGSCRGHYFSHPPIFNEPAKTNGVEGITPITCKQK